jgi:hypothetical protein
MIPLDDDTLGVQLAKCQRDREEARGYLKAAARAFGAASAEYVEWETRITRYLLMLNEVEFRCRAAEIARQRALQALREHEHEEEDDV